MNNRQPSAVAKRILNLYPAAKNVGIYGLAYKAGSSLTEESQAVMLAAELLHYGLKVSAYDPLILISSEIVLNGLEYSSNLENLEMVELLICTQTLSAEDEESLKHIPTINIF